MSGGFAIVQPDSVLSVNAVEGFPLEDFSADVPQLYLSNIRGSFIPGCPVANN